MRRAGIREARHDFSSLVDDVRKGREVVITERGRPVARLVPPRPAHRFPDLKSVRMKAPAIQPPLSSAIIEDREDRT